MHEEIDLSQLEPLIAMPSSPGNVVPVREIAGREIFQAYVGSSANPGYRDFAVVAEIVKGKRIHDRVSFDVNPTSRQILENLIRDGHLLNLIHAGARVHQTGCNGCIGMGQAPATEKISLRTVPRNFSRPLRYARGQSLSGKSGNGRRFGACGRNHRSSRSGHAISAYGGCGPADPQSSDADSATLG